MLRNVEWSGLEAAAYNTWLTTL